MTDDELIALITQVMRSDDAVFPDDAELPASFWDRVESESPRLLVTEQATPTTPRRAQRPASVWLALTAAACLLVVIGGLVLATARHPDQSAPNAIPSASSGGSSPATESAYAIYDGDGGRVAAGCRPGPVVTPTRSPGSDASRSRGPVEPLIVPDADDSVVDRRQPLYTNAFDSLTEVGGCVQAWTEPTGSEDLRDTTRFTVNDVTFARRHEPTGLVTVFYPHNAAIYAASSGNLTPEDLALALRAAAAHR